MKRILSICTALTFVCSAALAGNEYSTDIKAVADEVLSTWTRDQSIVTAVRDQNLTSVDLSQSDIDALDQKWRAQTISGGDMIDEVLANSLSVHLRALQAESHGQFSEIFVTDIRGLNVGQSDVTSDFWQGDEAKWQVPFATNEIHVGDVEFDESAQAYQSQVSLPIVDGGSVIGVITVGINLEQLALRN
ncbi:hypothetical protein EI983_15985 [Roseovarius faecimaris]|uniref:Chemotaxis protein n=1 Tax=Roseovarius faecimaris TaxID=2494550 RepID=A0A6I6IUW4_9RHOB|nr:PDC sensor domain-containing protein [Roseovarius faecimaris]QGX99683.1 hypothetical protein EI983_15985 [Roseovarius faecimaris]